MDEEWRLDEEGKYICRFNEGCHCDIPTCGCCGWNPEVAKRRLEEWLRKIGIDMKEDGEECGF